MKKIIKIIVIIVAIIAVLLLAKNIIAKITIENGVRFTTGLPLKVGYFNISFRDSLIDIEKMELFNPSGYPDKTMLNMPKIYVDFEVGPLLKGKVHLTDIKIHMKEFVVVKNKDGKINLDKLKPVGAIQKKKTPKKEADKKAEKKESKPIKLQIDNLSFRIDKVIYKDYSKGEEPYIKEFNINLNEKYENIDNLNLVISLLVSKALMKTSIASLSGFDVKGLQSSVSDGLKVSQEAAIKAAKQAQEEATRQTQEAADQIADKTAEMADVTQEKAKSLWGGLKEKTASLVKKD